MNKIQKSVKITGGYWAPRLKMNADEAIYYQWGQLEDTLCINNFRIAAGVSSGFREGFFFSDSDAYKWLDAASRILHSNSDPKLKRLINDFIDLIGKTQMDDGYINTYNQIHFPRRRWANLQVEHELYILGHLIEAGVSNYASTGESKLLDIVQRAADLLVRDFMDTGPEYINGHEEIEIALIKLYQLTENKNYLKLAQQILERRGKSKGFAHQLIREFISMAHHMMRRNKQRDAYLKDHPEHGAFKLPPGNDAHVKPQSKIWPRLLHNLLTGKYSQQHQPIREQMEPVGHAVRYTYLKVATAMLYRETGDETLLDSLKISWERIVTHRMYVTGGLGSLPLIEGFGRDYELNPAQAYAETCAALGCLLWNWEMTLITHQAMYADLFEWQLYNAVSVGIGLNGKSYLYNNPLESRIGMSRKGWFDVPCCPSNLSRVWASLEEYIASSDGKNIWVHQYISSESTFKFNSHLKLILNSDLPWNGIVAVQLQMKEAIHCSINFRIPSWTGGASIKINGVVQDIDFPKYENLEKTASGYDPRRASYLALTQEWKNGDIIDISFSMKINSHAQHPKVRSCREKSALTRGPIVYCLESIDNPNVDIFECVIDASSLHEVNGSKHFKDTRLLRGKTTEGKDITAIPYMFWANRGKSQMTTMIRFNERISTNK